MKRAWADWLHGSSDAEQDFVRYLDEQSRRSLLLEDSAKTWEDVLVARGQKKAYDSLRLTFTAEERERVAYAGRRR